MKVSQISMNGVNGTVRYKSYRFANRSEYKRFLAKLDIAGLDPIGCKVAPRRFTIAVKMS